MQSVLCHTVVLAVGLGLDSDSKCNLQALPASQVGMQQEQRKEERLEGTPSHQRSQKMQVPLSASQDIAAVRPFNEKTEAHAASTCLRCKRAASSPSQRLSELQTNLLS
jgi:hypothetical protein